MKGLIKNKKVFEKNILFKHSQNSGLVSSRFSVTSQGEAASLTLVGHLSSDGVTIKIRYRVDVLLHRGVGLKGGGNALKKIPYISGNNTF